ncbi:ATP-binding protein [Meridianimarinicoccus sp. RP-17]|uniref:ATP-binding protein n=1 Tax=Meridianimarinicoccus zhengii TaxID=2056810 RepID=UPI001C9AAF10|nr:ATP-binding protein [Phycocomes zhengii]
MRVVPRSLAGQLALLILAAFIAAQIIAAWIFADERGAAIRAAQRAGTAERATAVARALDSTPRDSHRDILAAVNSRLVRFRVEPAPLVAEGGAAGLRPGDRPHGTRDAMDSMHRRAGPAEYRLSLPLADGRWLNVQARLLRPDLQARPAFAGAALLSLVLVLGALWVGLRRITDPLRQLSAAAERFGLDGPAPDLPTQGPAEVRALSDALGRMHARLADMVAGRTRMLVALGHDLRSPITALRVRAEMVEDEETRARMVATLDEMQEMVEATLAYARGLSTDQPMERTDLAALARDLGRELSETGPPIAVDAPAPVLADIRRMAVRRALRNLIDNAQRYGGGARVSVAGTGEHAEIRIDDDGPGIPEADRARVFDPFTRLEASRSRDTGGIGLGLPIARAILRAHGGDVTLATRATGGLSARVVLPLSGTARSSASRA